MSEETQDVHEPLPAVVVVDRNDLDWAGAAMHFAASRVSEFAAYVQQAHPEDIGAPVDLYLHRLRFVHARLTPGCADQLGTPMTDTPAPAPGRVWVSTADESDSTDESGYWQDASAEPAPGEVIALAAAAVHQVRCGPFSENHPGDAPGPFDVKIADAALAAAAPHVAATEREACARQVEQLDPYEDAGYYAAQIRASFPDLAVPGQPQDML
jgi:hypothetical protein